MTTQDEQERLLRILHVHGQQFLRSFDIPVTSKDNPNDSDASGAEAEEWPGCAATQTSSGDESDSDFKQEDDDSADLSRVSDIMPVVFQEPARKPPEPSYLAKGPRKSFMSSKVSNVTLLPTQSTLKRKGPDDESDEERTNVQNDALLHRLVHTKLLSGSLNSELNLNHAQKGRVLAGRVLEISGEAKLGKGETKFRQEERNKAAKHVRDGLKRKQKMREQQTLEEAKNLGNYHPTLKRLYDSKPSSGPKKRARGLGMGVGKFHGGTLKLSGKEIASVTGSGKRARDDGRRGACQRTR